MFVKENPGIKKKKKYRSVKEMTKTECRVIRIISLNIDFSIG